MSNKSYPQRVPRGWDSWRPADGHGRHQSESDRDDASGRSTNATYNTLPFPIPIEGEEDDLPKLWDEEFDDLIGRTTRAYALVCKYEECEGGTRWAWEDICRVFQAGEDLREMVCTLQRWRYIVAGSDEVDKSVMDLINNDVEAMRNLCLHVQSVISETERPPIHQHY